MLKKIPTHQLRLGMFVHELVGSWMDHPFWRTAFKLTDERQLAQLRQSTVREVWIDTRKGLDVEAPAAALPLPPDPPEASLADGSDNKGPVAPAVLSEAVTPAPFHDEVHRASRIVESARPAMKSMFEDVRLGKAIDAEHCLPLVHDITSSVDRNPAAIVSLARLKTSDDYTYMHSVAVCALMVALARQLGLNDADTREAGLAGLVHDLGKALMPPEVLNKPGSLTPEEFTIMKGHPQAGHQMLLEARGVGPVPLDVCLHHHERVDGRGYPDGLAGEQISLHARMGAVCDVYDAITSNRPYKAGWDPAQSIQRMAQWTREGHFDNAVFQAFVKSIGIYPTGSLVKLRSGRLGVILDQAGGSLLNPRVRVFHALNPLGPIPPEVVDLSDSRCGDAIESRENPAQWGFQMLDDLWLKP